MLTGQIAEGSFFREATTPYVPNKLSIPVASGGAALFSLLAYHKYVSGRRLALVQSNTMRALYTVPRLLDLKVRVVDSTFEDFMSMNPDALERALDSPQVCDAAVVLYSVIGGYLAPSFERIVQLCRRAAVPLIVDGAHAHYLDGVTAQSDVDIAYSFYATKILPAGEGGLISTADRARHEWLRRFLIYDRFSNELQIGLNLRASELGAALMHRLMTDSTLVSHFKLDRIRIANGYRALCAEHGIRYLDPAGAADYNGYKFVILDSFEHIERLCTALTGAGKTSGVFDTDVLGRPTALSHWCPPTYASLSPAT
jgi:dTDP-4-amino-4,6-dideoxygalactose transaminase